MAAAMIPKSPRCSRPSARVEALRRSALLAERLAARASLTSDEARDVRHEIQTMHDGAERIDAMLTLRGQNLRLV
jgi:hypothetical protein